MVFTLTRRNVRYSGHQVTFHFQSSLERSYENSEGAEFLGAPVVGSDSFFN